MIGTAHDIRNPVKAVAIQGAVLVRLLLALPEGAP